jgi:hypothetical protein
VEYWDFDSDATGTKGFCDGTVTNAAHDSSDYILGGGSYSFDGTGDHIALCTSLSPEDNDWSISAWFQTSDSGTERYIVAGAGTGVTDWFNIRQKPTNDINFIVDDGSNPLTDMGTGSYNDGAWHHVVMTRTASNDTWTFYVDGTQTATSTNTDSAVSLNVDIWVGDWSGYAGSWNGNIDEIAWYNVSLSPSEVSDLYNSGSGQPFPTEGSASTNTHTIIVIDGYNSSYLSGVLVEVWNGSAVISNTTDVNGVANFYNVSASALLANLSKDGYYKQSGVNLPVNDLNTTYLERLTELNISFGNYYNYSTRNVTRNLTYQINYSCPIGYYYELITYLNGGVLLSTNLTCDNTTNIINSYYSQGSEGPYNLSFALNETYLPALLNETTNTSVNEIERGEYTFYSDLYPPVASVSYVAETGFTNGSINISLLCIDNITPELEYNISYVTYSDLSNNTNGTNLTKNTGIIGDDNIIYGRCADPFGNHTDSIGVSVYVREICLIDERDNSNFNVSNLTSAKVFYEDNSSVWDFQSNNQSCVFYTSDNVKLRFELGYDDPAYITRWVDVTLLDSDVRVCANPQGTTHYAQLPYASSQRAALIKSVFSDCWVTADYTRFAYQDTLIARTYTIETLYYLYTQDVTGNTVYLSSIDGSLETSINLDTLEFNQEGYNLDILGSSMHIDRPDGDANQLRIYYYNELEDNEDLALVITRMDTDAVVLNLDNFSNNNEFTLYFNWATLTNITNETLFKASVTEKKPGGLTTSFNRYFNTDLSSGTMPASLAFTISLLITFFGLTIAAIRITLGWFGAVVQLMSIAVLSFAVQEWYITALLAGNVIALVYILINLAQVHNPSVT